MVRVYELEVEVAEDGKLRVEIDSALPPGRHHAKLLMETNGEARCGEQDWEAVLESLPKVKGWPWGPEMTFSRKQIYDDDF